MVPDRGETRLIMLTYLKTLRVCCRHCVRGSQPFDYAASVTLFHVGCSAASRTEAPRSVSGSNPASSKQTGIDGHPGTRRSFPGFRRVLLCSRSLEDPHRSTESPYPAVWTRVDHEERDPHLAFRLWHPLLPLLVMCGRLGSMRLCRTGQGTYLGW